MSDSGSTPPPPPPDSGGTGGYNAPPPYGGGMGAAPPDNKLVWSILVTIFCCLPLGIVAIIKSAEVNSKWAAGDQAGAHAAAADAGKWIKWSAILGVIAIVISIVFYVLAFALAASSSSNGL